jgi:cytochrome c oxidase cbb3-type subunit 4
MQALADNLYPVFVILFMALFIGIVVWAWWPSRRQKARMQDHAEIPFRDDEPNEPAVSGESDADKR